MRLVQNIALALGVICARPARSALMALTLGAGAGAATLVAAVLGGYGAQMERMVFGAYARSLVITENRLVPDRFGAPRRSDLDRLLEDLGVPVDGAAAWRNGRAEVRSERERLELQVFGVSGDFRFEADMPLAQGRDLTPAELTGTERVCMLGRGAANELFGPRLDRTGSSISVGGISCTVIGVFQGAVTNTAERYSQGVFVPLPAMVRYFDRNASLAPDEVSQLTIVLGSREDVLRARTVADRILRREHGAPLSHSAPFRFGDENASLRAIQRQRNLLTRLLLTVASVSLLAAGIGYGASTMTAIETRRRDLALQMTAGAQGSDILAQIMVESLLLGFGGAVLGALLAYLISQVLVSVWEIPVLFDTSLTAVALAAGIGAGLIAGAIPAWRAANAHPALAVRS